MIQIVRNPLYALVETMEEAVMVTEVIRIGTLIVDGAIAAASEKAAQLYGYEGPLEIVGRFTSMLYHPDDHRNIKFLSIARRFNLPIDIPPEYDVRAMLPDGSIRYIRKKVTQVCYEDKSYWVVRPSKISPSKARLLPDLESKIPLSYREGWFGEKSVSEFIESVLGKNYIAPNHLTVSTLDTIMAILCSSSPNMDPINLMPDHQTQDVEIELGQSRRLPDGRWIHRCGKCARIWVSGDAKAQKCARNRADEWAPSCGSRRWREVSDAGREIAAQFAVKILEEDK